MRAACLRVWQLLNQTELGSDVGLPQPTVHRWLTLLKTSYLLVRLPACAENRTKRLIKSPRIFRGDTGVALHLEAAPRRLRSPAHLPAGVRAQGARRTPAAHRSHDRVADPRRAGRTVVDGVVTRCPREVERAAACPDLEPSGN